MIGKKRFVQQIDKKLSFELWIETGSVYKAAKLLKERHGMFNTRTGKNFSQMAVWDGAWKYILENMLECRPKIADLWRANGELLTEKIWYELVCEKAKYVYSKKKYDEFIKTHLYLTPYQK